MRIAKYTGAVDAHIERSEGRLWQIERSLPEFQNGVRSRLPFGQCQLHSGQ